MEINEKARAIYCIVILLYCGILALIMAINMNNKVGSKEKVVAFRKMAIYQQINVICRILWQISEICPEKFPFGLNWLSNFGDLASTGLVLYYWHKFVLLQAGYDFGDKFNFHKHQKKMNLINKIPITLLIAAAFFSFWTHDIFYINDNNVYIRGDKYWFQVGCCYFYLLFMVFYILKAMHKKIGQANELHVLFFFSLFPIFGGILQVFIPCVPFSALSAVFAMFYLFIKMQGRRINTDALTGLFNRARLHTVLKEKLKTAKKEPIYLFMADVVSFKQVNDQKGHIEGDRVLIDISKAFQKIQRIYPSLFASRYGGDEFLFIIKVKDCENPEEAIKNFKKEFQRIRTTQDEFSVGISVGYCKIDWNEYDLSKVIYSADSQLYKRKQNMNL